MFEKFMLEVKNNAELGAELRRIFEDETVTDKSEALIEFGKKNGYEFTQLDIKDFAEKLNADDTELSDDDLEAVAGGSKKGAQDFWNAFTGTLTSVVSSLGLCFLD